jgi:AraC-like DNA-binding protein
MNQPRSRATNPSRILSAPREEQIMRQGGANDFGRLLSHAPRVDPVGTGRQGFMRQNMELDFVNHAPAGREFSVTAKNFGLVRVARVDGGRSTFTRADRHLADNRDLISLVLSNGAQFRLEGTAGTQGYGRHGAAVLESRRESVLHCVDDGLAWTIIMDRAPLEPYLARPQAVQCCIPASPALQLLDGYLAALFGLDKQFDPTLASQHIRDLALSAIGVTADAQEVVRQRGVAAARLEVLLDRLSRDATEAGLDPTRFAERMGVSARYLHRLLEPTGRSFSEHLLTSRLTHAAAMLRDPRLSQMRIGEIAEKSGFRDLSHFSRSFRRHYGDTPHGWRVRGALRRDSVR